jgi:hypothetical protein
MLSPLNTHKVQVNAGVTIEEEMGESEDTHSPCYHCVLERKGSYLPMRRSPETSNPDLWDLSVAGLHKRQAGMEAVKRLKHMIIQFDTENSRCIC